MGATSPLSERPFRLLWLGRVSSSAGDAIVPVALSFAVLSVHASAFALGAVLASLMVTRVAFTLAGGVVADRLSRRSVMIGCDLARGAVHAFTAGMLLTHHMTVPLFIVTEAIFGTASAFFTPASDGLVPQTTTMLAEANALLGLTRNTLNVFGPVVSGALVATAGPGYVFAIDAASFAASAFFLAQLHVDSPVRERASFAAEIRTGFREVVSRDWVRVPLIGFAFTNFTFAAVLVLGPVVFLTHFHHAKLDWGIVSTCGSLGAIVGALLCTRLKPKHPLYAGAVASALVALPLAALAGPLPVAAIAVAIGLAMGSIAVSNVWWETTLQQRIPEHVLSRVRSYDILVSFVFMPVGMVCFGPIARGLGYEWTLLAAAGVAAASGIFVAFAPAVRAISASPQPSSCSEDESRALVQPAPLP